MKIYNLFPLLAGPFPDWAPHLERAADMGFDWIYVNPIQQPGRSGSLYSIADYFGINARLIAPGGQSGAEQMRAAARQANVLGLAMMTDLVINHCAIDSPLVEQHPDWFLLKRGRPVSPFCIEPDGSKVVWQDLAQFDHRKSADRAGLLDYCVTIVEHLAGLGYRGFRCDAAYQIPAEFWRELIERSRAAHPDLVFVAETLGCTPRQTKSTAAAGFDAIYNSAKWWDFGGDWLLDQYALTRDIASSISFPESHDTQRLFQESGGNPDAMRQAYLFTALFASHVMLPIGFEFGFRKRLHVVETRPGDWEAPNLDLRDFIRQVNRVKDQCRVFNEEGPIERLDSSNPAVLVLRKSTNDGRSEALLILNKESWSYQRFYADDLYRLIHSPPPLRDLSIDWPMDYLPTPFEFDLGPGVARVLVSESQTGNDRPARVSPG